MYGLTECNRVSYLPPEQIDIRPDSVGRGMPNQEVYIVDEDGVRVGPGIVGELVVRGSSVMGGYWNDLEETSKRLKLGRHPWERVLYTGDLFRADREGYLYFVARKDDIIKTRGEKVSPREIEEVLYNLEGIAEAVILSTPDPILGSAIKAVASLRPGQTSRWKTSNVTALAIWIPAGFRGKSRFSNGSPRMRTARSIARNWYLHAQHDAYCGCGSGHGYSRGR